MDALYFYKHSRFNDAEIRYSLRSVERHLPWIRKVWIFGDRPHFLSEDANIVEHVPHDYVARAENLRTPVTNFFLLFYLAAILPRLDHEFLWFCDDFIVLEPLSIEDAKQARVVEHLDGVQRGKGLWKESLWRTYDLLKRLGYPGWNFETHVPTFYTKTRVLEAYCDFRDFITEDRWFGMLGPTAILNHALTRELMPLVKLADEGRKIGFYGNSPSYQAIAEACVRKAFLNFDDEALTEDMRQFLQDRFPDASKYESDGKGILAALEEHLLPETGGHAPEWPDFAGRRIAVFVSASRVLPLLLNQLAILPISCLVLCPDAEPRMVEFYSGSRVRIRTNGPIDVQRLAADCDLAIGRGTPRFSEAMCRAGKPQLLLPVAEQEHALAARIIEQGIGFTANPFCHRDVIAKLRQVWELAPRV